MASISQRNASAALSWAQERKAKLQRAKQLRLERERGEMDENCTFRPTRYNNMKPRMGSSKMGNGTSAYSQQYLKDFHYGIQNPVEDGNAYQANPQSQTYGNYNIRSSNQVHEHPTGNGNYSSGYQMHHSQGGNFGGGYSQQMNRRGKNNHPHMHQAPGVNSPLQAGESIAYSSNVYQQYPSRSDQWQQRTNTHYHSQRNQGYNNHSQHQPQYYSNNEYHFKERNNPAFNNASFSNEDSLSHELMRHGVNAHTQPQHEEDDPINMSYEFASSATPYNNHQEVTRSINNDWQQQQKHELQNNNNNVIEDEYAQGGYAHEQRRAGAEYSPSTQQLSLLKSSSRGSRRRQNSAPSFDNFEDHNQNGMSDNTLGYNHAERQYSKEMNPPPTQNSTNRPPSQNNGRIPCTRQTGCKCSQCNADASFRSLLRSDDADTSRPPWNSDTENVSMDSGMQNPSSQNEPIQQKKPQRKARKRPEWNSETTIGTTNDMSDEQANTGSIADKDDKSYVQNMRDALTGGKTDFIEQVGSKPRTRENQQLGSSRPRNSDLIYENTPHQNTGTASNRQFQRNNSARRRQDRARNNDMDHRHGPPERQNSDAADNNIWAPHRGIYRPPSNSSNRGSDNSNGANSNSLRNNARSQRGISQNSNKYTDPQTSQLHFQNQQGQDNNLDSNLSTNSNVDNSAAGGLPDDLQEYATEPVQMGPCHTCGRSFNVNALTRHQKICKKLSTKKRKTFNSAKNRLKDAIQSSEDANVVKDIIKKGGISAEEAKKQKQHKKSTWKQKSAQLRQIAGKTPSGSSAMDFAAPADDLTPCPHCGRTFNEQAATRHIPKCKDQKAKPTRLKRGSGRYASNRSIK